MKTNLRKNRINIEFRFEGDDLELLKARAEKSGLKTSHLIRLLLKKCLRENLMIEI